MVNGHTTAFGGNILLCVAALLVCVAIVFGVATVWDRIRRRRQ